MYSIYIIRIFTKCNEFWITMLIRCSLLAHFLAKLSTNFEQLPILELCQYWAKYSIIFLEKLLIGALL